jgi:hypothetical protein
MITRLIRVCISVAGIAALLLGLLIWSGRALSLLPVHMLLGLILSVTLLVVAALALRALRSWKLAALLIIVALIMPLFGIKQTTLLPGDGHWVIRFLHLLVGMAAMGLGHATARRIVAATQLPRGDAATSDQA